MTASGTLTTIDRLTAIWGRLFPRRSVEVNDNFFELGGDPALAARLCAEISRMFGRELPPVVVCYAPTIAALASVLERPGVPRFPPLVQLRAGTENPPVFLAHGLGGSVLELIDLVRHIEAGHPIYGMQAPGTDGVMEPLDSIEGVAQVYLDAIKHLQSRGPYLLIGYSLGGLVTFEMARRLADAGDKVGLLTMVDAYPHFSRLSPRPLLRLLTRRTGRRLAGLFPRRANDPQDLGPCRRQADASFAPAIPRVRESGRTALKRYRPRFYDGRVRFVRAQVSSDFPDDPIPVWAHLAAEFEVDTVPGDHLGVLTTHYESLASVLTRHVKTALGQL